MKRTIFLALASVCLAACGGDDGPCDPVAQTGCEGGQVCEQVEGGEPACFAPVEIRGDVFNLDDSTAIADARVLALDVNRAAASDVAISDATGRYALWIPSTRDAEGNPTTTLEVTLRADATGYQTFPSGVRTAIPIDTALAVQIEDGHWVVDGDNTDIGLEPLAAGSGTASLTGHVELPEGGAAIVVAEVGGVGYDASVDRRGDFTILNLPGGDYLVRAYAPAQAHESATVTLEDGGTADVELAYIGAAGGAINGTLQFVDATGLDTTSVVLFVESTFVETLMRGAAPPGIFLDGVMGDFTLEGVPPGRYVVLAAFPDDQLVRDPDSCQAGTDIVHIEVADAPVDAPYSFKITQALAMISPESGAIVEGGLPSFSWVDDSSEIMYRVRVYDSLGLEVWAFDAPESNGADPVVAYDGNPLGAGTYQVRVTSVRASGADLCEISTTEDLAGVFVVP